MRQLAARGWGLSLFSLVPDVPDPASERVLGELCQRLLLQPFRPHSLARYGRLALDVARSSAFERGYFYSRAGAERARHWLEAGGEDVAIVGQLYMRGYLPDERRSAAILDSHNVELGRVRSMAEFGAGARRTVAKRQIEPVRRYESRVVGELSRIWAVSKPERDHFEALAPGRVDLVPNGVDCAEMSPRTSLPSRPELVFLGRMDYGANDDAVRHLIENILPRVRRRDVSLTIVGAGGSRRLAAAAARSPVTIFSTGYVPETGSHLEGARAMVVPLRFGAGTRLKILEALARGIPVLSTTLGCEGLELEPGRDLLVADDPADFAGWVDRLLEDDDLCLALSAAGRSTVEARYDWSHIGDAAARSLASVADSQ